MRKFHLATFLLGNVFFMSSIYAADDIPMSVQQAQALGIETAALKAEDAQNSPRLPAKVVIPNSQLQVVSAPVAGFVESMQVAVNEARLRQSAL